MLPAFALTLLVEVPLYALALRAGWGWAWWRAIGCGVVVNALTHPLLWRVLSRERHRAAYPLILVAAETGVWLVEWTLLALLARRQRPALAVVCAGVNAASVLAGAVLLR